MFKKHGESFGPILFCPFFPPLEWKAVKHLGKTHCPYYFPDTGKVGWGDKMVKLHQVIIRKTTKETLSEKPRSKIMKCDNLLSSFWWLFLHEADAITLLLFPACTSNVQNVLPLRSIVLILSLRLRKEKINFICS